MKIPRTIGPTSVSVVDRSGNRFEALNAPLHHIFTGSDCAKLKPGAEELKPRHILSATENAAGTD